MENKPENKDLTSNDGNTMLAVVVIGKKSFKNADEFKDYCDDAMHDFLDNIQELNGYTYPADGDSLFEYEEGITFYYTKKGSELVHNQLRSFIAYKCLLNGVKLIDVPPAYTSKMCHNCLHIGNRQGKKFTCNNCNSVFDADENAAKNIALLGTNYVNSPEKPSMLYCQVHSFLGLKPIPSLCVGG